MEKKPLKVFINKAVGGYCAGLLVVAANNVEEAHEVALADDGLLLDYWENDWEHDGERRNASSCMYQKDNWEELKNTTYFGVPCVLAEGGYNG